MRSGFSTPQPRYGRVRSGFSLPQPGYGPLGDMVYFLMSVAELHVVPGHVVDFIVVLAIAMKRFESQYPQHIPGEGMQWELTRLSHYNWPYICPCQRKLKVGYR